MLPTILVILLNCTPISTVSIDPNSTLNFHELNFLALIKIVTSGICLPFPEFFHLL